MSGKGDKRRPTDEKRFSDGYDLVFGSKTEWQDMAPPTIKGQPMPQTREYWIQLAARDQELILEQRDEISRLKAKVNNLQQKVGIRT